MDHSYIVHMKNLEAAKHHSTSIFHNTLSESASELDPNTFSQKWNEIIRQALTELQSHTEDVESKIELMERNTFDNFTEVQFRDYRAVTFRARKMIEYILKQEFIQPLEMVADETRELFISEMQHSKDQAGECLTILSMLRNEASKATDLHQISSFIQLFEKQLTAAEKNRLRILNQVLERSNALTDKFSLSAITRRTSIFRKFVR